MQEVVNCANTVFMSIISNKGSIALLDTVSVLFCQEDAKQVAGIPH